MNLKDILHKIIDAGNFAVHEASELHDAIDKSVPDTSPAETAPSENTTPPADSGNVTPPGNASPGTGA